MFLEFLKIKKMLIHSPLEQFEIFRVIVSGPDLDKDLQSFALSDVFVISSLELLNLLLEIEALADQNNESLWELLNTNAFDSIEEKIFEDFNIYDFIFNELDIEYSAMEKIFEFID